MIFLGPQGGNEPHNGDIGGNVQAPTNFPAGFRLRAESLHIDPVWNDAHLLMRKAFAIYQMLPVAASNSHKNVRYRRQAAIEPPNSIRPSGRV